MQQAWTQVERNRAIVDAAGMTAADLDNAAVVAAFLDLDARIVDLPSGEFTEPAMFTDPWSYDHWSSADPAAADRLRYVPIYLVWQEGALRRLVLPVDGTGMWSTIQGYLALEEDLVTVAALIIYRHGETPGIGDRIEDPAWLGAWIGRRTIDPSGEVRIGVARKPQDRAYQIDLISGASLTSLAVGDLVQRWLGPDGYGPLLQRLRRNPAALTAP